MADSASISLTQDPVAALDEVAVVVASLIATQRLLNVHPQDIYMFTLYIQPLINP